MSREERKMAQIIASIERMEQRKAAPATAMRTEATSESSEEVGGGSGAIAGTVESPAAIERKNSGEIHAQVQKSTRLGAKGRRLKPLSTSHGTKGKAGGGSSKGAKTPQELVVNKSALEDCRLTPKKRWIQLWNEQQSSSDEAGSAGEKKPEESTPRPNVVASEDKALSKYSTPGTGVKSPVAAAVPLPPARPAIVREEGEEEEDDEDDLALEDGEAAEEANTAANIGVQADASLSSPSPQTDEQKDTSISPVPAVKETPAARTPQTKIEERAMGVAAPHDAKSVASTPALESQPASAAAKASDPVPTAPAGAVRGSSEADDASKPIEKRPVVETTTMQEERDASDRSSRKRSLERKDSEPLTEEERRRAERRRLRKSNWDVGDPRFASRNGEKQAIRSPMSDDINSSSKFPVSRPAWRHSNSMDATYSSKATFPASSSLHRPGFGGGNNVGAGPSRRPFYSSNSLPLDRSRSAGRSSSSGYHHSGSYR